MKKALVLFVLVLSLAALNVANGNHSDELHANATVRSYVISELRACLSELSLINSDSSQRQAHYLLSRKHYKHVEFFVEYYSAREAKYFINGPLVPKHDPEIGNVVVLPAGFQRIEQLLFPRVTDALLLRDEIDGLCEQLNLLLSYYTDVAIDDGELLEMCQLELFRIAALNLNGYDATIALTGVTESAWSMEGVQTVVRAFQPLSENRSGVLERKHKELMVQLKKSIKYLFSHADYNRFPRLQFIVNHVNKINRLIVEFHFESKLPWNKRKQALNLDEPFLFGKETFNLRYFSMYYDDTLLLDLQAELGEKLFFDPLLSGNAARSCASCHNENKMFADNLQLGLALDGNTLLKRNAPSLTYVAYQKAFFYDGRAYQLEQQVADVVHNPLEMNGDIHNIVDRLRADSNYTKLFAKAFEGTPDSAITTYSIQKAITEFEKTLGRFNSRFDQYILGNKRAMSQREINGYNLFAGKALCGSCHFFPLFNGLVPPSFSDSEFEVIGGPSDSTNLQLDEDLGRYEITGMDIHRHAFKTPGLRNVSHTWPYMHNGIYNSLEQVLDLYVRGGGAGIGLDVPNQTLPFDSLQLTTHEREDIILFLGTLNDDAGGL